MTDISSTGIRAQQDEFFFPQLPADWRSLQTQVSLTFIIECVVTWLEITSGTFLFVFGGNTCLNNHFTVSLLLASDRKSSRCFCISLSTNKVLFVNCFCTSEVGLGCHNFSTLADSVLTTARLQDNMIPVDSRVNREGSESEWSDQWSSAIKTMAKTEMSDLLAATIIFQFGRKIRQICQLSRNL